ncbi:hypothetical protein M378DRAFT_400285 [Amanita muscaria Koide BX008]|uniref:Uncharacterized protein n=1 Tax=Amanita muscaria (strain Koide BX008) TaxID=946122 RepID=A0A0C2ST06_AMAMK|nr:hypothetical protein M378DRAFT_400285 [Amanita muscaria Koide BX008]
MLYVSNWQLEVETYTLSIDQLVNSGQDEEPGFTSRIVPLSAHIHWHTELKTRRQPGFTSRIVPLSAHIHWHTELKTRRRASSVMSSIIKSSSVTRKPGQEL